MIIASFAVPFRTLPLLDGYAQMKLMLDALAAAFPGAKWYRLPRDPEEALSGWIPVDDEDTYLRRAARDMGEDEERWPSLGSGFSAVVTTAGSESAWNAESHPVLSFSPMEGEIQLEIRKGETGGDALFKQVRATFLAVCTGLEVEFARCDVSAPDTRKGSSRGLAYSIDCRVFPHREFVGWMGFVKRSLLPEQVSEAAEVIAMPDGAGTVIVVVAGAFDLNNPDHVERAQKVEMRLVDRDALPVRDARFQ